MTHPMTQPRSRRRAAVTSAAGVAAAALAVGVSGMPAQAASPDEGGDFRIVADGYYATARIDVASDLPVPLPVPEVSGSLTAGLIESEVNSQGIEEQPEGTYSRAFASLLTAEGLDIELDAPYTAEQIAPPEETEPATVGLDGLEVPIVGNLDAISAEAKANWDSAMSSDGGVLTSLYSGVGQVDLVKIGDLGPITDLLPVELPLSDPLVSVGAGQLLQETGTFPKDDGSLGAYAQVSGRFGDVNVLGGAANGGVSVGIAGSDDGETPNAFGRLEATGEPGGATFDYELPALELQVGDQEVIDIEPGFDETFEVLDALELNVNFAEYRDDDTVLAEDGTQAAASGGGLALRLSLSAPLPLVGDVELTTAEVGLLSFPEVSVEVPEGGIQAAE